MKAIPKCKTCRDTGLVDDTEVGDIDYHQYPCPDCKKEGSDEGDT